MEHASREGVGWAIVTLLLGIGAAISPHPFPKLLCSLGAIGGAAKAANCFHKSAQVAYQQLAAPPEPRQLPAHIYYK